MSDKPTNQDKVNLKRAILSSPEWRTQDVVKLREIAQRLMNDPHSHDYTLGEWLDRWLDRVTSQPED